MKISNIKNKAKTMYHMLSIKALRKKPYPFYVNLVINSQCNLRCAYCFGAYSNRPQTYWDMKKLKKTIDQLYEKGTRYILVQGGEPLLHPDIRGILKYLKKKKIVAAIVTNGSMPDLLKKIPEIEDLDNICFSLDGNREGNDKVRGKGTFDKVLKSIEAIKKNYSTPIRINSAIHKYVIDDCDFMAEFTKENDIGWGMSYLFKGDEKLEQEDLSASDKEIRKYQKKIIDYKKKGYNIFTSLKVLEYSLNWPFGYKEIYVDEKKAKEKMGKKCIECQYGKYEIIIDEDGKIYPCNAMQGEFKAKSINDVGFDEAFENLKNKPCHTCYIAPMINTSAIINWDMNVITDTVLHNLKKRKK